MERTAATAAVIGLLLAGIGLGQAFARDDTMYIDLRKALSSDPFASALGNDIAFFIRGEPTPPVKKELRIFPTTSTTVRNKTSEQNCLDVLLKALTSMRDTAKKEGGNAVISLASSYRGRDPADASMLDCHYGAEVKARVALSGTIAQIDK